MELESAQDQREAFLFAGKKKKKKKKGLENFEVRLELW